VISFEDDIYSPIDGMITVLNSKLGERGCATNQFAGTEVMRVADPGHMERGWT